METVDAVTVLVRAGHYTHALILLYSAIDVLSWVNRPSGDVTRSDFCSWVREYMDPRANLGCSPEDLYAARCGMLHSGTAESKMSREGRARELWYGTSPRAATRLDAFRQQSSAHAEVVHFTALVGVFSEAVMRFSDDLAVDPPRQSAADARMRHWVRFVPSASVGQQP